MVNKSNKSKDFLSKPIVFSTVKKGSPFDKPLQLSSCKTTQKEKPVPLPEVLLKTKSSSL